MKELGLLYFRPLLLQHTSHGWPELRYLNTA
nr:MAG TPA: hypothetical protein [Caudoviricetes sp.]